MTQLKTLFLALLESNSISTSFVSETLSKKRFQVHVIFNILIFKYADYLWRLSLMPIQKCLFFSLKIFFLFFVSEWFFRRRVFGEMMNHNKWWLIDFPPTKIIFSKRRISENYIICSYSKTLTEQSSKLLVFFMAIFFIFSLLSIQYEDLSEIWLYFNF